MLGQTSNAWTNKYTERQRHCCSQHTACSMSLYLFINLFFPCAVSLQWLPPTRLKDNSPIHHPTSPSPLFLSLSFPPSLKLSLEFWQLCLYVQSSLQALGRHGGRARAALSSASPPSLHSQQQQISTIFIATALFMLLTQAISVYVQWSVTTPSRPWRPSEPCVSCASFLFLSLTPPALSCRLRMPHPSAALIEAGHVGPFTQRGEIALDAVSNAPSFLLAKECTSWIYVSFVSSLWPCWLSYHKL